MARRFWSAARTHAARRAQVPRGADPVLGVPARAGSPGWRPEGKMSTAQKPWQRIQAFAEREPALGWYDDADPRTIDTQLGWMHQYGIDYVVFDWYWGRTGPFLTDSIEAYFNASNRKQ